MGILDRFRRPEPDLSEIIAEEISKALANTPYSNVQGASTPSLPGYGPGSGGQNLLQTPGTPAVPLPRLDSEFGSQLGPAQPFLPAPLDPTDPDSGRALPRKWQYDVAWNLNLTDRPTPWSVLKGLADQCDVIHRCIEIRVAEVVGMDKGFTVTEGAVLSTMAEHGVSHARAMEMARDANAEMIADLTNFWESPYTHGDRLWSEWITEVLWQHLVYDAIAIYPRLNLGGKVIGLEVIDAATIKPLLDNRGDIPHWPAPAYQQILWGFPRGEYQISANPDGEFFTEPGAMGEYAKDQLSYFVRNRRTWSPYGFSTVEECIPAATLYLERQLWMRSEYTDGTMPRTFMKTDSQEIDPIKLASLERVLNDTLTGSTAERHRIKMLPATFDPVFAPSMEERYKPEYDEWLVKQIASRFGVQPTQLGIIPRSGLGGRGQMEGEQDQAESMSKRPLENFLVEVINSLSRRYLGASKDVTFTLNDPGTTSQQVEKAKALQVSLYSGQMTLNEVQAELGQPLYDMPEADEPFIVAGNAITFLKGLIGTDSAGETTGQLSEATAAHQAAQDSTSTEAVPASEPSQEPRDEAEPETKAAEADTFTPPKAVQEEAKRALKWIEDGHAGDGFTDTGRKRAADLARGAAVSRDTIGRIANYLGRHQGDSKAEGWNPGDEGYPSPGRVAWAAWGGDPAISWTDGIIGDEKAAAAETKAFKAFVAKRKRTGQPWRDFTFEHLDPETAKSLNAEGRSVVEVAKAAPLGDLFTTYREQLG